MDWNSALKHLMGSSQPIQTMQELENEQIFSTVIIPKITSKKVLNITTKRCFEKNHPIVGRKN